MSTHNIPGLQPGRNSMGRIARAVSTRATQVREALEAYDLEEENVRVGAAALLQSIDDERAPLTEEGEQLLAILEAGGRPPAPVAPATMPDPTPPPAPPVVVATPEPELFPVAPATTPVTVHTTTTPTVVHVARPNWGTAAWITAIIGGIAGLIVGADTREWIGDLADLHSGFGPWALKALWIGGLTTTGFYAGGYIISTVTNRARPINPNTGP